MAVSNIEQFKSLAGTKEITLQCGLTVEIQAPRLMAMVGQGKIPNQYMNIVAKILGFKKEDAPKDENKALKKQITEGAELIELYVMASLVNPSYESVKNYLDDDMKAEIAGYARDFAGRFRKDTQEQGTDEHNQHDQDVQSEA